MQLQGTWYPSSMAGADYLQGSSGSGISLQGNTQSVQGSSPTLQASNSNAQTLQPTTNPFNYVDPVANGQVLGADTSTYDPAAAAAAAAAAEEARKAGILRGDITSLVNSIKDIFNSRYGQVDRSASEQIGKLNDRFGNESQDITRQVGAENEKIGAAHASGGTYDSSYRGNNVDTVTKAGKAQIRDLGTELQDNVGKIGGWVSKQKAGFDAQKGAMDTILGRLGETTDVGELTSLRNTLDGRIAELKAGNADNNTAAENAAALKTIAPASARTVQLQTTLSQILAGNADAGQKAAIGQALISNSGLDPAEAQKLLMAFQSDISSQDKQQA